MQKARKLIDAYRRFIKRRDHVTVVKVAGALAGLALVAVGGVSAALPPGQSRHISWADERHRYGWVPNHKTFSCADPHRDVVWEGTVCATENGGRRWRTIFRGGNYIFAAVRTSARAGVVSTGSHGHGEWWTRDNGRHWFQTDVIGGDPSLGALAPAIAGRGNHLFWGRAGRPTVERVTPWPPTAEAVCTGRWAWAIAPAGTAHPAGNHCQGATVNAGMRSRAVLVIPTAALQLLAHVPAGFVATFGIGGTAAARAHIVVAVVHQRGLSLRRTLSAPRRLGNGFYRAHRIIVRWPNLTIRGDWIRAGETRPSRTLIWRSRTAGRSWQLTVRS